VGVLVDVHDKERDPDVLAGDRANREREEARHHGDDNADSACLQTSALLPTAPSSSARRPQK
jgi:hypothetical protein